MTHGKTIRIFLVDGTPGGIMSAEIINWTGQVLKFPRALFPEVLKREEIKKTGVYFLIGPNQDDPSQRIVYVGMSDNISQRLKSHIVDEQKDFFEEVAFFSSKDANITVGHAAYLEYRLLEILQSVGTATIFNGNSGSLANLPESEQSDMEQVLENLRVLMPVLGYDFLQEKPKISMDTSTNSKSAVFELTRASEKIHARAYESGGQLVVMKGSTARHATNATQSARPSYERRISSLQDQGKLVENPTDSNLFLFTDDVVFSSPSMASDLILGSSTNGRILWKLEGTDKTYSEWFDEQIKSSEAQLDGQNTR